MSIRNLSSEEKPLIEPNILQSLFRKNVVISDKGEKIENFMLSILETLSSFSGEHSNSINTILNVVCRYTRAKGVCYVTKDFRSYNVGATIAYTDKTLEDLLYYPDNREKLEGSLSMFRITSIGELGYLLIKVDRESYDSQIMKVVPLVFSLAITVLKTLTYTAKEVIKARESTKIDAFTGLYNKQFVTTQLDRMSKGDFSSDINFCLILDLDGLKAINSEYGHPVGDDVILCVSSVIKSTLVGWNYFGCRLGGDEFIILGSSCDEQEILDFSREVHCKINSSKCNIPKDRYLNISCSSGLVYGRELKRPYEDADELLMEQKLKKKGVLSLEKRE